MYFFVIFLSAPTGHPGSYATLGRPTTLPMGKPSMHRSNSDPDLGGSNPNSPDAEVASLLGGKETKRFNQNVYMYIEMNFSVKTVEEISGLK